MLFRNLNKHDLEFRSHATRYVFKSGEDTFIPDNSKLLHAIKTHFGHHIIHLPKSVEEEFLNKLHKITVLKVEENKKTESTNPTLLEPDQTPVIETPTESDQTPVIETPTESDQTPVIETPTESGQTPVIETPTEPEHKKVIKSKKVTKEKVEE